MSTWKFYVDPDFTDEVADVDAGPDLSLRASDCGQWQEGMLALDDLADRILERIRTEAAGELYEQTVPLEALGLTDMQSRHVMKIVVARMPCWSIYGSRGESL